jgi:hypothetical protein
LIKFNLRLVLLFSLELIVFCIIVSFQLIGWTYAATLTIFSLLFVSLTFPLNGSLLQKMFLLTVGNIIGLSWNLIYYYISRSGINFFRGFEDIFNAFCMLAYPFMCLIWIVPFWSLSISLLPKYESPTGQVRY